MNSANSTVFAYPAVPDFFRPETVVTYPFAAEGAAVKMHMRFQVGLLEGRLMFPFPQHLPCLVIFNTGKSPFPEWFFLAIPFLPAAIAEKTESKALFAGIIRCLSG